MPSGAQSFNNIEQMGGWQSCSECAGKNAHGPKAQFSMNQHQQSPSLDGNSTEFHIGGKKPYSDAIWWRNLGPVGKASHYVFDLNFYIQNPGVSEGLEFDINVAQGGRYYVFGNQCSPLASHTWDTWDMNRGTWNSTGITCNTFPANQWNHVTIEVERTSNNQLHWVSITYNGSKHYVDRYVSSQKTGFADGASIDFQMDGNFRQDAYSTWLDKVNLSYY